MADRPKVGIGCTACHGKWEHDTMCPTRRAASSVRHEDIAKKLWADIGLAPVDEWDPEKHTAHANLLASVRRHGLSQRRVAS